MYDPVTYASGMSTPSQVNYPTLAKEAQTIYKSVRKMAMLLEDAKLILRSDHKPLANILFSTTKHTEVNNWS